MPRNLIPQKEIDRVLSLVSGSDDLTEVAETLKMLYGENLGPIFSSTLRGTLTAAPSKELFVADLSKIEVAVLWWLADNAPGIKILKAGKDPYIYQAAANTGKKYEEIDKEGQERQLGKGQVLGCGFGCAWEKFQSLAADQYRLKLTDEQAQEAVKNYREANAAVPALWRAYESATIKAIENRGSVVTAGKCKFFRKGRFLWVELPSGRRLAYLSPRISWRVREYTKIEVHPVTGEKHKVKKLSEPKKTIEFLGLDKTKKKMQLERTWGGTLTENIVQATARELLIPKLIDLERAKYLPVMAVHDEAVCERKKGRGNLDEFIKILCTKPKWADENLVVEAKGYVSERYKK